MQTTVDAVSASSYGVVDPDDFWKNLRDWDFLSAYVKEVAANKQPRGQPQTKTKPQPEGNAKKASNENDNNNKNTTTDNNSSSSSKSLPDTYISHRHYIASWAPLCLAECRAQMLSEALQNTTTLHFHPVLIETPKSSMGSAMDSVLIICRSIHRGKQQQQRSDLQFYANDCVLLVPTEHVEFVQRCMKEGKDDDKDNDNVFMRKYGLLGHAEHTRKGIDGLQLKLSKKHWAKAGRADMSILKIGCNITAWREFTALCRVESIPLTRHLLGHDLDGRPQAKEAATTKAALLNKMGGTTALGKGFTKYVNSKFNQSQLMAISAAAMEYGQGGFTLIKGPPGTGK
jgi:senataxin